MTRRWSVLSRDHRGKSHHPDGLRLTSPNERPCDFACGLKIHIMKNPENENTTTRIALSLVLGIACYLPSSECALVAETEQRQPNVVFISTDDQGTLDAGCSGSTEFDARAFGKLASHGTRLPQPYSHAAC